MKRYKDYNPQLIGESAELSDKAQLSLEKKSNQSGIPYEVLEAVYHRGIKCWSEVFGNSPEQFAFDRVNSFIAGGFARELDEDLAQACWKGYTAVGMKKKNGRKVPNCVPVKEATFQGKQVPLNKPMKGDVKKSKVYVDPDGDGKAQKVNFGDKKLSIKKDQPDRKASYCARSGGIKGKSDVTSANYWSRKAWNCEETEVTEDAEKHSNNFKNPASRFDGSDELVKVYKSMTPGQIRTIKRVVREHIAEMDTSKFPMSKNIEDNRPNLSSVSGVKNSVDRVVSGVLDGESPAKAIKNTYNATSRNNDDVLDKNSGMKTKLSNDDVANKARSLSPVSSISPVKQKPLSGISPARNKTVKEAIVAAPPPPQVSPPPITRPAPGLHQRMSMNRSGTGNARLGSGSGAMRGGVQIQRAAPYNGPNVRMNASQGGTMKASSTNVGARAAPPRAPSGSMPAGSGGAMNAKPTVGSGGLNKTEYLGRNMGSKMGDGVSSMARKMTSGSVPATVTKAAGSAAGSIIKGALKAAGPVGAVAGVLADAKPLNKGEDELARQKQYGQSKPNVAPMQGSTKNLEPVKGGSIPTQTNPHPTKQLGYFKGSLGDTSIKAGDTLSKIAADKKTTVSDIMANNPTIKDSDKIAAGSKIFTSAAPTPPKRSDELKPESGKSK